jgi:hypothetical protein
MRTYNADFTKKLKMSFSATRILALSIENIRTAELFLAQAVANKYHTFQDPC